ncbi:MAG: helicase-associated domain-containing protein [Chloroflexota bacterium]
MKLYRALLDYDPTLLAAIAGRRGVELTATRQPEMVEQLAAALLAPESVREVVAWLSPPQRAAIDALLAAGGRLPAARFGHRHGVVRRMGPGRLEREKPWRDPISPAEALFFAGLLFFTFDESGDQIVETVFLPDDLLPLLPPAGTARRDFAIPTAPAPRIVRHAGRALAEDLTTLLAWIETDTPAIQPDASLRPAERDRLAAQLIAPLAAGQTSYLDLLLRLAGRLEMIGTDDARLRLHRPAARAWLHADPAAQMLALQRAWRDDPDWNDLAHVPSLRLEHTGWRNEPLATRLRVLGHLARCPIDAWIRLEDWIDAIRQTDPDFQRPPDAYATWYIRDAASGEYLMGFEHWPRVEGALVAHLIAGPLYWSAATAVGFEAAAGPPTAFCLTPGGAFFLGLIDQPPQAPPLPPMAVDADLTIRTLAGGRLYDRFQLARIAEWQASGEVYVYRLTPASLGRALGQGIRLNQMLAFLKRVTADQLPPKTADTLHSWADRHTEVRLTRAAVLETPTAAAMRTLRAHPQIGPLMGQALSPTRALIAERDWQSLRVLLAQAGYRLR